MIGIVRLKEHVTLSRLSLGRRPNITAEYSAT